MPGVPDKTEARAKMKIVYSDMNITRHDMILHDKVTGKKKHGAAAARSVLPGSRMEFDRKSII